MAKRNIVFKNMLWKSNSIAAIPEDMDALQSQMRGADMNIAMLLTWNYMATEFNKQINDMRKQISEGHKIDIVFCDDDTPAMSMMNLKREEMNKCLAINS